MELSPQFSIQSGNSINMKVISQERFHRLRRIAFRLCVISFIIDIVLGLKAFVNCIRTKSFVGFSYSVHTLMDSLCTSFVSWHLIAKSIGDIHRRDTLACCVIGALFIGSFLAIETRAIQSLMSPPTVRPDLTVVIYSYIHISVFTILSIIKFRISKEIRSIALRFDTLNSIIGIIMVLPLLVWDRVIFINKFTHLDDLVQVLMALFLFVAGGKLILDSITIMNTEYARKLRDAKLKKMLKDVDDGSFDGINSNHHIVVGT
jgi:divalent metal cation (Fe/Co/Zn/Cd) transporter